VAVLASGKVRDRPLGALLYALCAQGFSGRLVFEDAGRQYWIELSRGAIVDAFSPDTADSLAKLAIKTGLASKTQISAFLAARKAQPETSEEGALAQAANLDASQLAQLRRLQIAQAAARTFALEDASFRCDSGEADERDGVITVEWVIYQGLRRHYSRERLLRELAPLSGTSIQLGSDAGERLSAFGFTQEDAPILSALGTATTVRDLAQSTGAEHQHLLSLVYALWATGDLVLHGAKAAAAATASAPSTASSKPAPAAASSKPAPAAASSKPAPAAAPSSPVTSAPTAPPPDSAPAAEGNARIKVRRARKTSAVDIEAKIRDRLAALDADVDHFALLGVERGCSSEELQQAYFKLAKSLHPDRVRALGIDIPAEDCQRLFARVNKAFSTLSNPGKRSHYLEVLVAGGELAYRRKQEEAATQAANILAAEEHFLAGEMALRRNNFKVAVDQFEKAMTLNPDEGEHHVMYAWARWMSSADKDAVLADIQSMIERGLQLSPKCVAAYYFLGELAVHGKRHAEALDLFEKTLKLSPDHREAQLQLRLLRSRGLV